MAEEIGVIEDITKGNKEFKLFGRPLIDASDDELCIAKFYEPTWHNLFKYQQLGTFKPPAQNTINKRDIVKVTIEDKHIKSVWRTGTLSKREMAIYTWRGEGAIAIGVIGIILLVLTGIGVYL